MRVEGDPTLPTLIYLPGIHGDWTLIPSFRAAVRGRVRFVEFTYPRTLDWTLADYAAAVRSSLERAGILHGWLLAESFGSQVAWPLCHRPAQAPQPGAFTPAGLILAGGFVRYPIPPMVGFCQGVCNGVPISWLVRFLGFYARFARWRHRHATETRDGINEFVARRTALDKLAAEHRLRLIRASDPRPIAASLDIPLFHITGGIDPIVPWMFVRPWLRRNCPTLRGTRILWGADHNVLGTAPAPAASQILDWIRSNGGAASPTEPPQLHTPNSLS